MPIDPPLRERLLAMIHRRRAIVRMGGSALASGWLGASRPGHAQDSDDRLRSPLPAITQPILFNTPEADRILERLPVFPADNPWNAEITDWPLHPNSRNIIASIGADKPLRYNPGMNF